MNLALHPPLVVGRRKRRGAFALVVTLLILSLLVVVAVSYLSSMVSERQTADAYSAKARAEQAAQAGVDSAMAILAQSFRDFPDSATVWDAHQSINNDGTVDNEGTSLYLRAVDTGNGTAEPLPKGVPAPGGTPVPANDPGGNNPNNPACKNFVLPLISGVPSGKAQLVSKKPALFPAKMGLDTIEPVQGTPNANDPAQQNSTDLNIRRFKNDIQGVIGSPPDWTGTGPKPARAYWINLKDSTGHKTGRYAFWIEDESFRTNINYANFDNKGKAANPDPPLRADNSADGKTVVDSANSPRSVLPKDVFLTGALAGFPTVFSPTSNTQNVLDARDVYPTGFLPERLAFTHAASASATPAPTPVIDGLRYLTTTQSGSLNLTRHGTQRANLNAATTINAGAPVTMPEIRKLVETIRFHLPNFGQRFYRTTNPDSVSGDAKSRLLNRPDDVKPDPGSGNDHAEAYLYKTAANLRDYIDADCQPTMIVRPMTGPRPTLAPAVPPKLLFGSDGIGTDGTSMMWAQGKEAAPFLQETVVRYRPSVTDAGTKYSLTVDYYLEFWNMSDKDITAADLGNTPFVRVANQQSWHEAYIDRDTKSTTSQPVRNAEPQIKGLLGTTDSDGIRPWDPAIQPATPPQPPRDFNIDILHDVYQANNPNVKMPNGVVFKAGSATVITTDPDYSSVINSQASYGGQPLSAKGIAAANVYYCSLPGNVGLSKRIYHGEITLALDARYLRGIMPASRGSPSATGTYLDYETEIMLGNSLGYIDCANGSVCISTGNTDGTKYAFVNNPNGYPVATNGYNFTWKASGDMHNDYLQGGSLGGNGITASEMGDPRTNNEQLVVTSFSDTSYPKQPDQSRYAAPGQTDMPPYSLGTLNSKYVQPIGSKLLTGVDNPLVSKAIAWGDYYDWKDHAYPTAELGVDYAPSVIADASLTSIGQLGDLFDPVRVIGNIGSANINNSRGGGRTLKIGQRDDRYWYDPTGNTVGNNVSGNNTPDNVPNSNGWAAWRLTDVFCIADALEMPARVNVNGAARDGGAALRAALTGFRFQPTTQTGSNGQVVDPRIHNAPNLANAELKTLPADVTGVSKLVKQIVNRLDPTTTPTTNGAGSNTPCGPFFERGELGELENSDNKTSVALFGKNVPSIYTVSTDLATTSTGTKIDLNHTFDRGREELFRRLVELTCTRGDTFTVYVAGQSLTQPDTAKPAKITGTHRMRVTFRLVPRQYADLTKTKLLPFCPGNVIGSDGSIGGSSTIADPDADADGFKKRFAKPDLYDIQVLEVNPF